MGSRTPRKDRSFAFGPNYATYRIYHKGGHRLRTILERGDYIPKHRCISCDWFRWINRRGVCYFQGDVRKTLEPGAIADFCDNYSTEFTNESDPK